MAEPILDCGTYAVLMDCGFFVDVFELDSSTLDGPDVLDGSVQFFDVTEYVAGVSIRRGRNSTRERIEAGTCQIRIRDLTGDFSVVNSNSPYWNTARDRLGFEPTKRVRVERDGELLFAGAITEYRQEITLDGSSYVTVAASDDLQRLTTAQVAAHTPAEQLSGERLAAILDRSEVNLFVGAGRRNIADGVAPLGAYPVESDVTVRDYFDRVQTAEQGRIFMARDGVFTAQERVGRAQLGTPLLLSDAGDGGIGFDTFTVEF